MTTELNGILVKGVFRMSKYRQFEVFLEGYLDEKLRKSHIGDALSEGFRYVELDVFANGRLKFIFGGENSFLPTF